MARKKSTAKWIVGGVVIAGTVIALSFLSLGENAVYFYQPEEATKMSERLSKREIKVGGMVKEGSVEWVAEAVNLTFTLTNMAGIEISVQHRGSPPDLFKEGQGVVVEGKISQDGSSFQAKRLMVKHSEEYKAPGEGESMDEQLLKDSLFKKKKEY